MPDRRLDRRGGRRVRRVGGHQGHHRTGGDYTKYQANQEYPSLRPGVVSIESVRQGPVSLS
jgi:hypothetical protein